MPNLRVATVNANGVRAAYRKGMREWLEARGADIVAVQEVRAELDDLLGLVGDGWHVLSDAATKKGYAGVALLSRTPAVDHRTAFGPVDFDSAGRWIEGDFDVHGQTVTVVSCYINSGEVGTPRQDEKWKFLDSMLVELPRLAQARPYSVVVGDFNIGHRKLDIKNWRGNVKNSGFLPEERAYLDKVFGAEDDPQYNAGAGLGYVDVGRKFAGEVDGPYTWWSNRGQAFDNDTGWRIDYHAATPALAATATAYAVDRAQSYDERWSDHAPVVVDYAL